MTLLHIDVKLSGLYLLTSFLLSFLWIADIFAQFQKVGSYKSHEVWKIELSVEAI